MKIYKIKSFKTTGGKMYKIKVFFGTTLVWVIRADALAEAFCVVHSFSKSKANFKYTLTKRKNAKT